MSDVKVVMSETREKIINIIAEQAQVDRKLLTPDANLTEIGLDSMNLVEIVFAVEEEFDISVPFNANDPNSDQFDLSTVDSVVVAVERLIQEQKGG